MNGAAKKLRNAKIHIPDNFEIAPLTENNFAKKPLAERGGAPPPPLNGKSPKISLKKSIIKG